MADFDRYDYDFSGSLERDELEAMAAARQWAATQMDTVDMVDGGANCALAQERRIVDSSTRIDSTTRAIGSIRRGTALAARGLSLRQAFYAFNASRSGLLSASELYSALRWLDMDVEPKRVLEAVARPGCWSRTPKRGSSRCTGPGTGC